MKISCCSSGGWVVILQLVGLWFNPQIHMFTWRLWKDTELHIAPSVLLNVKGNVAFNRGFGCVSPTRLHEKLDLPFLQLLIDIYSASIKDVLKTSCGGSDMISLSWLFFNICGTTRFHRISEHFGSLSPLFAFSVSGLKTTFILTSLRTSSEGPGIITFWTLSTVDSHLQEPDPFLAHGSSAVVTYPWISWKAAFSVVVEQ